MIAKIVMLILASLLWGCLALLCREMRHGDGFGRSMARGVGTLALIALAILLGTFWGLATWRGMITAGECAVIVFALAVASFQACLLLAKIGHPDFPRWLAPVVLAPWAAHLALAGVPTLAPTCVPGGFSRAILPATVFILGAVVLPLPWVWHKK